MTEIFGDASSTRRFADPELGLSELCHIVCVSNEERLVKSVIDSSDIKNTAGRNTVSVIVSDQSNDSLGSMQHLHRLMQQGSSLYHGMRF